MKLNHAIEINCPCCKEYYTIIVDAEDYFNWCAGKVLTQTAFPYLNASTREMLISGICPSCWDKIFGEEEEKAV